MNELRTTETRDSKLSYNPHRYTCTLDLNFIIQSWKYRHWLLWCNTTW